jgi:uncharacterized protein YndB with AHSA1/START domain
MRRNHRYTILAAVLLWASSADAQERQIKVSVDVSATPEQVWRLWTSDEGVRSFFAPDSRIEPRVDGAYEIFFNPAASPGEKGADGMRVLALEPPRRLAFTWNAPATMPAVRSQRTVVSIEISPLDAARTRVTLRHQGWGTGPEWDRAIEYFEQAWNGFVMPSFQRRVASGPINWKALPELRPVQTGAIEHLHPAAR